MNIFRTSPGLLAASVLAIAFQAQAVTTTTGVDSTQSAFGTVANSCLQQLSNNVGGGENCMYGGGPSVIEWLPTDPDDCPNPRDPMDPSIVLDLANCPAAPFGESTGPWSQVRYYDFDVTPDSFTGVLDASFTSAPGDDKIRQVINGSIAIDDMDNGFGADDEISFTLTMTSPAGGDIVRNLGADVADRYTSMTQVLAARTADFVTPNALGGFDYVIGTSGFPLLLTFTDATTEGGACVGQTFGNMECGASFTPTDFLLNPPDFFNDPIRWQYYDDGLGGPVPDCSDPNMPGLSPLCWRPTDVTVWTNGFMTLPTPPGQFDVPHLGPSVSPGLGSIEGNFGARTIGTLEGLQCNDDGERPAGSQLGATSCTGGKTSYASLLLINGPNLTPGLDNVAEDVGWDHVYLRISTDEHGNIHTTEGFDVQEYQVFGANFVCGSDPDPGPDAMGDPQYVNGCNSWLGEHFEIAGVVALADMAETPLDTAVNNIDVLANDIGFVGNLTVTLPGGGTSANGGTVLVNGSPGPQGSVPISYTPPVGFVGLDTFDYAVADATNTSTATVTIDVLSGTNDDTAMTRPGQTVTVAVGLNDIGFVAPVTVTSTGNQAASGGAVTGVIGAVTGDVTGPAGDLTIDFTPAAANGIPTYTETFTYDIMDGAGETDSATVTITVNNALPNAVATSETVAESGQVTTDVSTLVGFDPGDAVSVITATGPTSVADTVITYTAGLAGAASYDYTITDADGETSTATVTVTVTGGGGGGGTAPPQGVMANPDQATVRQGESVDINVTLNDQPGSGALADHTVAVTTPPSNGSTSVDDQTNVVTYTPNNGFNGTDRFNYTLRDVDENISITSVTVTVSQFDELPSASAIGPWSLALLILLPGLRQRRNK